MFCRAGSLQVHHVHCSRCEAEKVQSNGVCPQMKVSRDSEKCTVATGYVSMGIEMKLEAYGVKIGKQEAIRV